MFAAVIASANVLCGLVKEVKKRDKKFVERNTEFHAKSEILYLDSAQNLIYSYMYSYN